MTPEEIQAPEFVEKVRAALSAGDRGWPDVIAGRLLEGKDASEDVRHLVAGAVAAGVFLGIAVCSSEYDQNITELREALRSG